MYMVGALGSLLLYTYWDVIDTVTASFLDPPPSRREKIPQHEESPKRAPTYQGSSLKF